MLLTMKELLSVARKNNFAVGAFNITDSVLFETVLTQAEKVNAPVIIELAPPEFNYVNDSFFAYVTKRMTLSAVPCVLHLDHGASLQDCVRAIRCGFTSVMIDGSKLTYDENIKLTSSVVNIAHMAGVSVEGEIGTIGSTANSVESSSDQIIYTKPSEVTDFVSKTNVDSLAIAIGTSHGIYKTNCIPKLQIELLKEINKVSSIPLVLHGGSSNSDDDIIQACKNGVNKVNIASDFRYAFYQSVTKTLNDTGAFWGPKVFVDGVQSAQAVINHKMTLFNSIDKADLYVK